MSTARRTAALGLCAVACLLLAAGGAVAESKLGNFSGEMQPLNADGTGWNQWTGSGDGWNENQQGPWFFYPPAQLLPRPQENPFSTPGAPLPPEDLPQWWNEWWYDDPFDPLRWKIIDLEFDYGLVDPAQPGYAIIVVNWSTGNWVGQPGPPLTNTDLSGNVVIERLLIEELMIPAGGGGQYSLTDYRLPIPYNPEWISIDVRGFNFTVTEGKLWHECVPEPLTILGVMIGLGGLVRYVRRRG